MVRKIIGQRDPKDIMQPVLMAHILTKRGLKRGLFYLHPLDQGRCMLMGPDEGKFIITFDDRDPIICDTADDAVNEWLFYVAKARTT
jgi:hypothetical protein